MQNSVNEARPVFSLASGTGLVLASGSPRRQEFLRQWGLPFTVVRPHGVEPHPHEGQDPSAYAKQAARAKARAAWAGLAAADRRHSLVLAADTIVVVDKKILGKPRDAADALAMLMSLSGRAHHVTSAVCLVPPQEGLGTMPTQEILFCDTATVHFHSWPESVLRAYVATHEPDDKAGAYAVQGQGAFLVERVDGAWSTVVGLPLTQLATHLLDLRLIMPCRG